ncbi:MAG: hypothetical protein ACOCP8_05975 [archaeon]
MTGDKENKKYNTKTDFLQLILTELPRYRKKEIDKELEELVIKLLTQEELEQISNSLNWNFEETAIETSPIKKLEKYTTIEVDGEKFKVELKINKKFE